MENLPAELQLRILKELDTESLVTALAQKAIHPFVAVLFDPTKINQMGNYADIADMIGLDVQDISKMNELRSGSANEFFRVTSTNAIIASYRSISREFLSNRNARVFLFIGDQFTGIERVEVREYYETHGLMWDDIPIFTLAPSPLLLELRKNQSLKFLSRGTKSLENIDTFIHINSRNISLPDLKEIRCLMGVGGYKYHDEDGNSMPHPHERVQPMISYLNNTPMVKNQLTFLNLSLMHAQRQDTKLVFENLSFPQLRDLRLVSISQVKNIDVPLVTDFVYTIWRDHSPQQPYIISSLHAPSLENFTFENFNIVEVKIEDFQVGDVIDTVELTSRSILPGINTSVSNFEFLEHALEISCYSDFSEWDVLDLSKLRRLTVRYLSHAGNPRGFSQVKLPDTLTHLEWLRLVGRFKRGLRSITPSSFPQRCTFDTVMVELTVNDNPEDLRVFENRTKRVIVDYGNMIFDPFDRSIRYWIWNISEGESFDTFEKKLNNVMYGGLYGEERTPGLKLRDLKLDRDIEESSNLYY